MIPIITLAVSAKQSASLLFKANKWVNAQRIEVSGGQSIQTNFNNRKNLENYHANYRKHSSNHRQRIRDFKSITLK